MPRARQISPIAANPGSRRSRCSPPSPTQDRVGPQCRLESVEVDQPVGSTSRYVPRSPRARAAHRVERRLVLGLHRHDVLALLLVEVGGALSARLIDSVRPRSRRFPSVAVDQRRDLRARVFDRLLGFQPNACDASGIAEVLGQPGIIFCATRGSTASSPNSRGRSESS